ncbi:GspH/FimT family pseudopilin [Candidatus Aalborgicola defluviihabitans]|uniref:GspH/FimT family pseudopilin n=1 Tax=Candidatus Aalborgicola defluviihabitans TaxID=3386187 RepID=UPI001D809194|nr:GspH/FimT family pseudopilin [Burkholderiales bacterium]MBK7282762.1 GspH/FimT family pseudopilin [Burkholderiales bacterium]MBL0245718.1 GspH/FimT family pseudopilin [Rhodoferax sp.]
MKTRPNGFTIIEVMITVAIMAILASLAMPSFSLMLVKRSVQSASQALVDDFRYTRTEALRRSKKVSICSLAANSTSACSGAPATWANGWMIFTDQDGATPGTYEPATEEIIRVQQPPPNIATIQQIATPANTRTYFMYEANGWSKAASETFEVTPTSNVSSATKRIVCISNQGRPRLLVQGASGATACNN